MTHMAGMRICSARALPPAALATLLLCAAPAMAQDIEPHDAAPPPAPSTCTDVQVGSAQSYDCVNARLGAVARGQEKFSSDLNAPVTASDPSNRVGTFNEQATRERLGPNFGKSVQPYRPITTPPTAFPPPRAK